MECAFSNTEQIERFIADNQQAEKKKKNPPTIAAYNAEKIRSILGGRSDAKDL